MNWPRPQVVFEPSELAELLQRELPHNQKPIVVDVRPEDSYGTGHLNEAVWLDLAQWIEAGRAKDEGLDRAATWFDRIGKLGIGPKDTVIVYDDGRMVDAARVWFILQHFGVGRAAVLNGGYPAIKSLIPKSAIAADDPDPPRSPVVFHPPPNAKGWVQLADKNGVRASLEKHDARILDVRTPAEYSGTDAKKNLRTGHLPGAVNLSHDRLLDANGKLKPPETLRKLFAAAGLKRDERIVTHCQSGGRASLAALAAVYAGYGSIATYYMSFGEWAADERCPLAAPATQPK